MRVFIDTGLFVAFLNTRDANHPRAVELMKELLTGEYGEVFTSDYVFDEAVTVALMQTRKPDVSGDVGRLILGDSDTRFISMLFIDETVFNEAWRRFQNLAGRGLSFTDCVSITQVERNGIDAILSFNSDFDGLIARIG